VPFLQIHLTLEGIDPEAAEQACFDTGALSVTLADAADTPILEPLPGATPLWPEVKLSALYDADTDPEALTAALREALAAPALAPRYEELADRPWEREWLKDFRPMRFGRRLWIVPGGQALPPEARDAVVVELDPGLAFGTGTHATTALCLEWLDGALSPGARVFDVGCGSGILAIAALALGACGGDDEPAAESIPPPPKLSVPGEDEPPDIPESTDDSESTDTSTSTTEAEAPTTTEPPAPSGGTPAPATGGAPADSPQNDQPPPAGSPAERFEEFCSENPGAC